MSTKKKTDSEYLLSYAKKPRTRKVKEIPDAAVEAENAHAELKALIEKIKTETDKAKAEAVTTELWTWSDKAIPIGKSPYVTTTDIVTTAAVPRESSVYVYDSSINGYKKIR